MSKIKETGLIIRKETKFDKIRQILIKIFFKEGYLLEMELENLLKMNRVNPRKIIIPREIKNEKHKRL